MKLRRQVCWLLYASYDHCYGHICVPLLDALVVEQDPFIIFGIHQPFQLLDFRGRHNLTCDMQQVLRIIKVILPVGIYSWHVPFLPSSTDDPASDLR